MKICLLIIETLLALIGLGCVAFLLRRKEDRALVLSTIFSVVTMAISIAALIDVATSI